MFKTYSCVTDTHTHIISPPFQKKSKEKPTSCLRPAINPTYRRYNLYVHCTPQQNHSVMPTGPLRKFPLNLWKEALKESKDYSQLEGREGTYLKPSQAEIRAVILQVDRVHFQSYNGVKKCWAPWPEGTANTLMTDGRPGQTMNLGLEN